MKRALLVLVISCAPAPAAQHTPAWVSQTQPYGTGSPSGVPLAVAPSAPIAARSAPGAAPAAPPPAAAAAPGEHYRDAVDKIVAAARADRGAYQKLAYLTDRIGNRLSGSPALDKAIAWAARTMKDDGHDVRTEPVMVPHWVRGAESAEITAPVARTLHVLGLGDTVATPRAGITAPVVVVHDWAELEAKQAQVKGAIVLYDVAMPKWTEDKGAGYGETVQYRTHGPSRAAKLGALAVLMRSVTAHSLRTPHTGATEYDDGVAKIAALAVTVEDSQLIARLAADGPVIVHLKAEGHMLPDAPSANVIGELRGREHPEEIVVIGGHIDSWDVGQGAHDDGAGAVTMMHAITTLRRLGLVPRRTVRVVLFTNEENGLRGGRAYAKDHAAELPNTVLAVESDSGGFAPRVFSVRAQPASQDRVQARITEIAALLRPALTIRVMPGFGGADIGPMGRAGVPVIGLETDGRTYFDIHHTDADTLDKVDPQALADDVAAAAALAYVVADLPERLDAP
ncbi:MAG TPA: M20/M25/M40 family metallo-hydrolase [Kofleriaceae bacterium]|jgi:Zn-dependent M28 family amino/carboxypeptidase|nr:M20/M25/M40 family metallo-hydrolase [Kofleriaceae bacterium]